MDCFRNSVKYDLDPQYGLSRQHPVRYQLQSAKTDIFDPEIIPGFFPVHGNQLWFRGINFTFRLSVHGYPFISPFLSHFPAVIFQSCPFNVLSPEFHNKVYSARHTKSSVTFLRRSEITIFPGQHVSRF